MACVAVTHVEKHGRLPRAKIKAHAQRSQRQFLIHVAAPCRARPPHLRQRESSFTGAIGSIYPSITIASRSSQRQST